MVTNSACTIYKLQKENVYERVPIAAVFWQENAGISFQKYGPQNANRVTIFIPIPQNFEPEVGDFILKDNIETELDGSKKVSVFMQEHAVFRIMTVDKNDYGSPPLRHFEVGAK